MKLHMAYKGTDKVTVEVYKGSKRKGNTLWYNGESTYFSFFKAFSRTTLAKWETGTYYVKVTKPAKESGIFSIYAK